ncbi:Rare lipoprotein A precursor [Collimonas arenae]|uniref:Endolytic peptidoglycan transglycosylase RlpA n=1 Tax=Collimonas arenae TaxID=279058 RepID=A0A0A1FI76_9BURK|nr:Rare lipoprotein A precursor [Collimonas arenae]
MQLPTVQAAVFVDAAPATQRANQTTAANNDLTPPVAPDQKTAMPQSEDCSPASRKNTIANNDRPTKHIQRGTASWYGKKLHGRRSASGERFDMHAMTAAHPSLPLRSWVLVRNLSNGKMAILKVNDRGPFRSKRILDVSYSAAKQLGFAGKGTTRVEVRPLSANEMPLVKAQVEQGIPTSLPDVKCDQTD